MKISFLILTHNRPHLFLRCINSILQFKFSYPVEILVNNDSNDISEINIPDYNIKYFYYNNPNIGYIYKLLFDQSTGEYIFFLEDDDYLSDIFLENLCLESDLLYMNYKAAKLDDQIKQLRNNFSVEEENDLFQLSQIMFKKELLSVFPDELLTNNLHNDWKLFQIIKNKCKSIKIIDSRMFIQTCDAKDNISFKEYNGDKRFGNK